MCKIYVLKTLEKNVKKSRIKEVIEMQVTIRKLMTEKGNDNKIVKLQKSKILYRIHLKGMDTRMVFSFSNDTIKIYDIFEEKDSNKKKRRYDNICSKEEGYKDTDFMKLTKDDLIPSGGEIDKLTSILISLEKSALNAVPETEMIAFDDLNKSIVQQKWARKYPKIKIIFARLKVFPKIYKKLIICLEYQKKKDRRKNFISQLGRLAPLPKLVNKITKEFGKFEHLHALNKRLGVHNDKRI